MKLACLDCLNEVKKRIEEKRRAQRLLLNELNGNGLQQAQYYEGEIVALEFAQKIMTRALNLETEHAKTVDPASDTRVDGLSKESPEANGLGR